MAELWDKLISLLQDPIVLQRALATVVGGLALAFLVWLVKKIVQFPGQAFSLFRGLGGRLRDPVQQAARSYRTRLHESTFKIHHAWMKEGQTLEDILVPVVVGTSGQEGGIENLPFVLSQVFSQHPKDAAPRLMVIGGPGSGKSVSLRVAVRNAWEMTVPEKESMRVPVLITFSEYRNAGFELRRALADSLHSRGFELPRQGKGHDLETAIQEFVGRAVETGSLFVAVDALDELDLSDRNKAVQAMNRELRQFPRTPVILSCREAAWHRQISVPNLQVIRMAEFTPAAIRQFVAKWGFEAPKSSHELMEAIERQPHVADLARNPLMLTIVAFLYSQPKYRLPDNRAQFYEVCTRALLEEWDQAKSVERANYFDRPHKESLLAKLAYEHIQGENPAQDIEERTVLESFGSGMEQSLGLKRGDNSKMLTEIVNNSGLLIKLPPTGLRFPHQTFLEYFAAQQLLREHDSQYLLDVFGRDPERWREVLLLFCGLSTKQQDVDQVLSELLRAGRVELAVTALSEVRVVSQGLAQRILDAAEERLGDEPTAELLAGMGYVAANPRSSYAARAAAFLHEMLRSRTDEISDELLQTLLLAALRRPSQETTTYVVDNIDRLQLGRILPAMGDQALLISAGILQQKDLAETRRIEWIDGLRRAGAVALLFHLACMESLEKDLRDAAEVALARSSTGEEFWEILDRSEKILHLEVDDDRVWRRWGWPFETPSSEKGKRMACRLGRQLAAAMKLDSYAPKKTGADDVHPRLVYLACSLFVEQGQDRNWDEEPAKTVRLASPGTLRSLWRKAVSERWAWWIRNSSESKLFLITTFGSGAVVLIWSLASTVARFAGWGDLGMEWSGPILLLHVTLGLAHVVVYVAVKKRFDAFETLAVTMPGLAVRLILDEIATGLIRIPRTIWVLKVGIAASIAAVCVFIPAVIWFKFFLFLTISHIVALETEMTPGPPAFATKGANSLYDLISDPS